MIKLAVFGSGNGTNAQRIAEYFSNHPEVKVDCIIYNKRDAYIAERAKNLGIDSQYFGRADFQSDAVLNYLQQRQADYIILAGFLWLVPENLLAHFAGKIVNIHPALLPNYGGKGMYGHHVHEAVVEHGEKESGITIHLVDNRYDHGTTLLQAHCPVLPNDTPDTLAARIHHLEYSYYPVAIEHWVMANKRGDAFPVE